jgi:hypothetical protein
VTETTVSPEVKSVTVYSPVPTEWQTTPEAAAAARARTPFELGKSIAIVDNGKLFGFAAALESRLYARGAKAVHYFHRKYQEAPADDPFVSEIENLVDAAVVGLGN